MLEELNQPLSDSAYHRAFLAQLERRAETAVRLANEAADQLTEEDEEWIRKLPNYENAAEVVL